MFDIEGRSYHPSEVIFAKTLVCRCTGCRPLQPQRVPRNLRTLTLRSRPSLNHKLRTKVSPIRTPPKADIERSTLNPSQCSFGTGWDSGGPSRFRIPFVNYSYLRFDRPPLYRIRCLSIDRVGAWQPGIAASTGPNSAGSHRAGNLVNTSAPQPVRPPQSCSRWRCTLGFHE